MALEEYESAIYSFDQAIRLNPNETVNWNDKGVSLRRLYRFTEAIECFQMAQSLDPNSTIPRQNIEEARRIEQSLQESAKKIVKGFEELSSAQRARFYRASYVHGRALQLKQIGQEMQAARQLENAMKEYGDLPCCQSLEWSALEMYCDAAQKQTVFHQRRCLLHGFAYAS